MKGKSQYTEAAWKTITKDTLSAERIKNLYGDDNGAEWNHNHGKQSGISDGY